MRPRRAVELDTGDPIPIATDTTSYNHGQRGRDIAFILLSCGMDSVTVDLPLLNPSQTSFAQSDMAMRAPDTTLKPKNTFPVTEYRNQGKTPNPWANGTGQLKKQNET
jgi:hypothetical protein